MIEATIGTGGQVQNARVLRSIPLLDEAALDAVRQWVFTPTVVAGIRVPVVMTVTVNFDLSAFPNKALARRPPPANEADRAGNISNSTDQELNSQGMLTDREKQLLTAARTGEASAVAALIVNLNVADRDGVTPLMLAASRGSHRVIEVLLAAGADPDAQNVKGFTALMLAVIGKHLEAAAVLINAGADPGAESAQGITALDLAKVTGDRAMALLVADASATDVDFLKRALLSPIGQSLSRRQ
jgi:TonB family protein